MRKKKYNILDTILIPIRFSPFISTIIAVFSLIIGIVPTLQTLAVAKFINIAIKLAANEGKFNDVLFYIGVIIVLIAISWLSKNIKTLLSSKLELDLRKTFRVYITEKKSKLKYFYAEDSDTWDLISRISLKPETRLKDAYMNFFNLITLIIRILGLMVIFISQSWQVAAVLFLICVPLFFISLKSGQATYKARLQTEKYHRKHAYLAEILTNREAAQERVLFNYSESVCDMWHEDFEKARKIELVTSLKWFVRAKLGGVIATLISVVVTISLINPVLSKVITTGMFMSLVSATYALVDTMTWSFVRYIEQIANNNEYMKEITRFVFLEEFEDVENKNKSKVLFDSIEFIDVKFKYPGTDQYILNGFNFKFEKNKHYALVGANGAGKTTLVKLLTGLYDNYEGEILLNGKDYKEYSYSEISSLISTVYQDYARYSLSIKDNILVGNIEEYDTFSDETLNEIIREVGLMGKLDQYSEGLNTKLGKIYENGQDMSGGQWQRIALARSIASKAPICILDEPTSALDPVSESNLYRDFHKISNGKTVLLISHRLGSTKLADKILVLKDGRLIEVGTHHQLMEINGVYANMYESQRSWYGETAI